MYHTKEILNQSNQFTASFKPEKAVDQNPRKKIRFGEIPVSSEFVYRNEFLIKIDGYNAVSKRSYNKNNFIFSKKDLVQIDVPSTEELIAYNENNTPKNIDQIKIETIDSPNIKINIFYDNEKILSKEFEPNKDLKILLPFFKIKNFIIKNAIVFFSKENLFQFVIDDTVVIERKNVHFGDTITLSNISSITFLKY